MNWHVFWGVFLGVLTGEIVTDLIFKSEDDQMRWEEC